MLTLSILSICQALGGWAGISAVKVTQSSVTKA